MLLAPLVLLVVAAVAIAVTFGWFTRTRHATQQAHAQVDAMVRNAPIGMAFVDRDSRFVEINETLAALGGERPEDLIGRLASEIPSVQPLAIEMITEVLRTGASNLDVPFKIGDVLAMAGFYPVRGADGAIDGVGIVVREVTAEQQRDLLFERVTRLQELTASLAGAGTTDDVVNTAVRSLQHALGARATSFFRVVGDRVEMRGTIGHADRVVDEFSSFAIDADLPIAEAIRTGEPVLIASRQDALRHPLLKDALVGSETEALAAIPLRGGSVIIGAVGLSFRESHPFDADEAAFLVAAATQCATAYERALAFEAEREVRHTLETANRRLSYLSEATRVLAESLDPETTLQRLAELAVPTLADWCAVHLVEGDVARPVAVASENPDATALVRELSERHPVRLDDPAGLGAVIRTGEPIVLRSVTMDAVRASTSAGEVVDLLSLLRSIAIVPMSYGGRVVGSIMLSNVTERELEDADVSLASELASRAAQAVINAQLYQERADVAATLQASLLPPSHPVIPGVDVATRFVPAAEGLQVGGDFYDVVRLGTVDEPSPTWALVIGDVRGKGADAAAITGIARATIRATALDEPSPARMLNRLNQVLLAAAQDDRFATETGEPRFCTACVITVTPTTHGADLVVAVGGHPRPFILRADATSEQVGKHGGLIGVMPEPDITDVAEHLAPGDSLVLYTDGITERHEGTVFFDEEQLGVELAGCVGLSAVATAAHIEGAARGFVKTPPRDDIAVVVARVPERAAAGTVARQALPDDDRAAGVARRFVGDTLRVLGVTNEIDVAELLTSELVTNALVHGLPPVDIEIATGAGGLRVAVGDHNPHIPTMRVTSSDDEHGRGLLLVDALATRWGVDAMPPGKRVWFDLAID